MRNFGPYYGEHTIELAGTRPLTIIYGPNMRGKTSLLNALRWGLYGRALDRFGHTMPISKLINWDAAESGDWSMSVHLDLEVEPDTYHLMRHVQAKHTAPPPEDDKDFEPTFQVQVNGNFLSAVEAAKSINRIFPETISRFFLFDGELLNDYETLIADPATQGQAVKESIERILGLPALTNGLADLQDLLKAAGKRQQALAKDDENAKLYASASARLESEVDQADLDVAQMSGQLDEYAARRANLDEELRATAGIEQDATRLQELDSHTAILESDISRLEKERAQRLTEGWQDLLQPMLQHEIDTLQASMTDRFQKASTAGVLRSKIQEMEKLRGGSICPTCRQPVVARGNSEDVDRQILEMEEALKALEPIETGNEQLGASMGRLRRIRAAGVGHLIRQTDDDIRRAQVDLADTRLKHDEINDRLRTHDHTRVVKNRHDYELLTKEIGAIENRLRDKRDEIADKQNQIAKFRAQITREAGPAMAALNREVVLFENLVTIFQSARDTLRDALRVQVGFDASAIFMQMTTDKSYSGLRINEQYGLTILDDQQREVQVRSAGAEQVVALALIGALNRNAVRRGPLIMDTPFGRLDPQHRVNILRALPELTDQVALFVHEGEIDRMKDLVAIQPSIDREYEIRFVTSRRSDLVALER
jgi:DNA sulfur modification protein DndD